MIKEARPWFKHVSRISVHGEVIYGGKFDAEVKLLQVSSIKMYPAHCAEQENRMFFEREEPVVDHYGEIAVIRIGGPRCLTLTNPEAQEVMLQNLKSEGGILSYWDDRSIAVITNQADWEIPLRKFFTLYEKLSYDKDAGLKIY